jgi:hypothetical protein
MAVSVSVCRSPLSMTWGHNAAALGLPHVQEARVVGESPSRYDFLSESAATGQSHPRRALQPRTLESETFALSEGVSYGATDS